MTQGSSPVTDPGAAAGGRRIRAVLFDLDGTLYPKLGLRGFMLAELALAPLSGRSLSEARADYRQLRGFRRFREELRDLEDSEPDLEGFQYREIGRRLGVDPAVLRRRIDTWIHRRPLKYMRLVRRSGLPALLDDLRRGGLRLGVFSDYPAADKLRAMGLADAFDLVLDAEDPAVSALKPHPKGLLEAARRWGLQPAEVLYVGDRPEVDGGAAERAGMPCAILSRRAPRADEAWLAIRDLRQIVERLAVGDGWAP